LLGGERAAEHRNSEAARSGVESCQSRTLEIPLKIRGGGGSSGGGGAVSVGLSINNPLLDKNLEKVRFRQIIKSETNSRANWREIYLVENECQGSGGRMSLQRGKRDAWSCTGGSADGRGQGGRNPAFGDEHNTKNPRCDVSDN